MLPNQLNNSNPFQQPSFPAPFAGPSLHPQMLPLQVDFSSDLAFSSSQTQQTQSQPQQAQVDPNSPELFKKNLHLAYEGSLRLQRCVQEVMGGIQNAYREGYTTPHTKESITALNLQLKALIEHLVSSGIGALPLLPLPLPSSSAENASTELHGSTEQVVPPSEAQMLVDQQRAIEVAFERLRRARESAGVVANLVGGAEGKGMGGK